MSSPKKPRNPDHVRPRRAPSPDNEVIAAHLQDLLTPSLYSQFAHYRSLGLRDRILTLPLMLAAVLTLLWRQVPSVHELTRMLAQEDLLWAQAVTVSQQALSKRFLTFPAELFARVVQDLLPVLNLRQRARKNRPHATSIHWAARRFLHIWAVDGSTLEALFRKLDSLQTQPVGTLAGKIGTVLDMVSHLPVQIWFDENPQAHDTIFWERLQALVPAGTLLVLDRGFYDFTQFAQLMAQKAHFVTRLKKNTRYQVLQTLSMSDGHKDQLILLTGREAPLLTLRLVMIHHNQTWYSYLSSVIDPQMLPPYVLADLYRRRWGIEDAFQLVKRLLGLSYLWTGSLNGVQLQVWATWLFYGVLVDLSDAVAEELAVPWERISLEMVFRGLYHFTVAYQKGKATDPVRYFAAVENQRLRVVKVLRKPEEELNLDTHPT